MHLGQVAFTMLLVTFSLGLIEKAWMDIARPGSAQFVVRVIRAAIVGFIA